VRMISSKVQDLTSIAASQRKVSQQGPDRLREDARAKLEPSFWEYSSHFAGVIK
jgi:hypothetical protein